MQVRLKMVNALPQYLPLRLLPGDDIRRVLVDRVRQQGAGPAFLISAIGSLTAGRLRFADDSTERVVEGPLEIIALSGSITADGAHLHMSVSDKHGRVTGGHVCFGNVVRTTVEGLLVFLPDWHMTRAPDPATGFDELLISTLDNPGEG
jgi:predicted DNA-binding protein with PD1-like motif